MSATVTNVIFAGLGGQGVLKASDILTDAAFLFGLDVKKSELHGMSQRGGSVTSDVRFGANVLSPMIPTGEADFLIVLDAGQVENNYHLLGMPGLLITPEAVDISALQNKRCLNVALLGALSVHLPIPPENWQTAITKNLPPKVHAMNLDAFALGQATAC